MYHALNLSSSSIQTIAWVILSKRWGEHTENNKNKPILCHWNLWLNTTTCFSLSNAVLHWKTYCHASKKTKNSSIFQRNLPQFPLLCDTPRNCRTKTTQHFGWLKDVESFSPKFPRDPSTDQWKTSILLFLLSLLPLGLWCFMDIGSMYTPSSILVSLGRCDLKRNKMHTEDITLWEADIGQR